MTSFLVSREPSSHFVNVSRPLDVGAGLGAQYHMFNEQPAGYPLGMQRMQNDMVVPNLPITSSVEVGNAKQGMVFQTLDQNLPVNSSMDHNTKSDVQQLHDDLQNPDPSAPQVPVSAAPSQIASFSPQTNTLTFTADADTSPASYNSLFTHFSALSFNPPSSSPSPTSAAMQLTEPPSENFLLSANTTSNGGPIKPPSPTSQTTSPNTATPNTASPLPPSSPSSHSTTSPSSPRNAPPPSELPLSLPLPHSSSNPNLEGQQLSFQQQWESTVVPVTLHNDSNSSFTMDSPMRSQTKLASEELLDMCRRQGLVPQFDNPLSNFSLQSTQSLDGVSTSNAMAVSPPGNDQSANALNHAINAFNASMGSNATEGSNDSSALHGGMMGDAAGTDGMLSGVVELGPGGNPGAKSGNHHFAEKMMYRNSDSKMVMMPAETFVSIRQQLEAAKTDKARLSASLKSAQNACARKDEQIMDLQRRHGLLVQQYNSLQSMYQGVLTQLQAEQQQASNSSMALQGEMQNKQQIEQLLQLLNKQLQQEQQQKKAISVKLASEAASRQQLQEQLNAMTMQLQQQAGNVETVQWLQGMKKKLEDDVGRVTGQLQQEQKRRNDVSMQLQGALADRHHLQAELTALRSQLQPPSQGMPLDHHFQMQHDEPYLKSSKLSMPHSNSLHGPLSDFSRGGGDAMQVMPPTGRAGVIGYGQMPIRASSAMVMQQQVGGAGMGPPNGGGNILGGFGSVPMPMRGAF